MVQSVVLEVRLIFSFPLICKVLISKMGHAEFKELRKQWRQAKKEADEQVRERERERATQVQVHAHEHSQHAHMIPHPAHGYPHDFDHHTLTTRHTRRRSLDPYPDPHGMATHHGYGSLPSPMSATFSPSSYGLAGPGLERYNMPSPTELEELRYPEESSGLYRSSHHQHSQHGQGHMHEDNNVGGWPQSDLRHGHPSSLGPLNVGPPRGGSVHPFFNPASQAPSLPPAHTFLPPTSPGLISQPPLPTGHAQGQFSTHQQEQELPQLAAPVSLGHNRLPPDSTLLTALPGFNQGDDGLGRGYD